MKDVLVWFGLLAIYMAIGFTITVLFTDHAYAAYCNSHCWLDDTGAQQCSTYCTK